MWDMENSFHRDCGQTPEEQLRSSQTSVPWRQTAPSNLQQLNNKQRAGETTRPLPTPVIPKFTCDVLTKGYSGRPGKAEKED